jgi:putative ABC transport system permease protein
MTNLKLASASIFAEKLINISLMLVLAAVITPIMLLFSIRYGVVSELVKELKTNPNTLQLHILGFTNELKSDFFETLNKDPAISFVVPAIRSTSALVTIKTRDAVMDMIEVMPTASGDPLLKMSKLDDNLDDSQMFISQSVADKFKVRAGDELRLLISRKKNEVMEAKSLYLKVKGVLPRNLLPKNALMVNLKLLFAIEDYRDGYEPLLISDGSSAKEVHRFYSARIYVSDLDDVEPMTRLITSRFGLEISSAITSIKQFKDITDVLNVIFLVLTVISCIGGILAFGGIIYNNLFRARASYAMLLLTGFSRLRLLWIVTLQNLMISFSAYFLSVVLLFSGQYYLNNNFAGKFHYSALDKSISVIDTYHLVFAGICIAFMAFSVSVLVWYVVVARLKIAQTLRQD